MLNQYNRADNQLQGAQPGMLKERHNVKLNKAVVNASPSNISSLKPSY